MTDMFPESGIHVGCAVHHTDGGGNTIPCPGHPHAEQPRRFADFDLEDCPHCEEPQPAQQMDAHVSSAHGDLPPCTARIEPDHGGLYTCAFRVGHKNGEHGNWHASTRGEAEVSGRYVWNDTAKGATPHQPPEQSDAVNACMHSEAYEGECPCVSGCGCCKVAPAHPRADGIHFVPDGTVEISDRLAALLPPFSGDDTTCTKCGHGGAITAYRAQGEPRPDTNEARLRGMFNVPSNAPERLERGCFRCGYVWDEALAQPATEQEA